MRRATTIEPELHARVLARVAECTAIVNARRPGFAVPDVYYFEGTTTAGLAHYEEHKIGLHATLLRENVADMLHDTIAHEVAHLACLHLARLGFIRGTAWHGHGRAWKGVMRVYFGIEPKRTASYDLTNVQVRRQRRWEYRCECRTHRVTTLKHNRMQRVMAAAKQATAQGAAACGYRCRHCKSSIEFVRPV